MTDLTDDWKALGHPWPQDDGCTVCGAGSASVTISDIKEPVTWRCKVCRHLVCRRCTLCYHRTNYNAEPIRAIDGGREYLEDTFCSLACWEKDGRPLYSGV